MRWRGLAMIEFLYDSISNDYKIIELNPRLWGSLLLAEFCGSQMLENYCLGALGEPLQKSHIQKESYLRWFFPWELLVYLQQKGKIRDFWSFDKRHTCYVNFTYGSLGRSLLFLVYNMASPEKIRRLLRKIRS